MMVRSNVMTVLEGKALEGPQCLALIDLKDPSGERRRCIPSQRRAIQRTRCNGMLCSPARGAPCADEGSTDPVDPLFVFNEGFSSPRLKQACILSFAAAN